jgi:hypothetical protein
MWHLADRVDFFKILSEEKTRSAVSLATISLRNTPDNFDYCFYHSFYLFSSFLCAPTQLIYPSRLFLSLSPPPAVGRGKKVDSLV